MNQDFKIHCILLTKNEADVVGLCLSEASRWASYIYVYDGGSTDETWEIVQSLKSGTIIPWKQDSKVFSEGLRAEVFSEFRHLASEGDWWLQLNVDEFYPEDPRQFFRSIRPVFDVVWGINVEYSLTKEDVEGLNFSLGFDEVRAQLRYYKVFWSEPRAFRYRKRLVWNPSWAWPRHMGLVASDRIVFKHYPYRSSRQIQTRLDVRRHNRARGFEGWEHASEESWTSKIVRREECQYDDGISRLKIDERHLPRHLESSGKRLIKRLMKFTRIWP